MNYGIYGGCTVEPLPPNGERFPASAEGVENFFRDRIVSSGHIFIGDTRIEIGYGGHSQWSTVSSIIRVENARKKPDGIPLSFLRIVRIYDQLRCKIYRNTLYVELFYAKHDTLKQEYLFRPANRTYDRLLTTPELFDKSNYVTFSGDPHELKHYNLPLIDIWMRTPAEDDLALLESPYVITRANLEKFKKASEANLQRLRKQFKYEPPKDSHGNIPWNPRDWDSYNDWREVHAGLIPWTPELIPEQFFAFLWKHTKHRIWGSEKFKQWLVPQEWTASPFAALNDYDVVKSCPYLRDFAGILMENPDLIKQFALSDI